MRPVPPAAVALVKRFEGLRLAPYRDAAGFWTIGWGHLVSRDRHAPPPPELTEDEAEILLDRDLAERAAAVRRLVRVPLAGGQYGALISFAYNVGSGALQQSTLLRKVNAGDHAAVPAQFLRWVMAAGVRLPGLVRRRQAEANLYEASDLD